VEEIVLFAKKIIFVSITVVGDSSLKIIMLLYIKTLGGALKNIPTIGLGEKWSRCCPNF